MICVWKIQNSTRRHPPRDLTDVRAARTLLCMKIVVADKISERGIEILRDTNWIVATPAPAALASELADAEGLIVRSTTKVNSELLEKAALLRVVGRAGVGVDNVDVDAATNRGVLVMNTPGGNSVSVAEHTIALMLALARSVPQFNAAIHAGRWDKSSAMGTEVRGKTLGLVGLGRIGSEVARRATALEMKIVAHDPYVNPDVARELDVELLPLPALLAQSDYISLHTSLSAATENMINAATLAQMKRGARIINCARGELIDEAALAQAIRSGHIAGAALDTFAHEPPADSPLVAMPNVIATPHIAGSTSEAQEEVGIQIALQVRDFLAEGVIRNSVNLPSLSGDQYKRVRPYLELAERLGSLVAQAFDGRTERVRIRYAGEASEVGARVLGNAVLVGVLNRVLAQQVNIVNATSAAAARGIAVEESTRRRERGFPNTIEVTISGAHELSAEGTVLADTGPRILRFDGIDLEAPLAGTLLLTRNRDVPGVIGHIGTALGSMGINIATFALGRRAPTRDAEAVALVRLDGEVPDSVAVRIRELPSITAARIIRLSDV